MDARAFAMDSLGCVIAEMYLDGEVPFDLPGLLSYRSQNQSETVAAEAALLLKINKITDPVVQVLSHICGMLKELCAMADSEWWWWSSRIL